MSDEELEAIKQKKLQEMRNETAFLNFNLYPNIVLCI